MTDGSPRELHDALDLLIAQYLLEHPKALPSQTSVLQLAQWNCARIERTPGELTADEPLAAYLDSAKKEFAPLTAFRAAAKKAGFKV